MRHIVVYFLLTLSVRTSLNKDQLAEISYNDQSGKLHTLHLQYYIDNQRLQYGVRFAISVHQLSVENCKVKLAGMTEEYFAAYFTVPESCNALDLIHDCETHGASFIFLDGHKATNSQSKLLSNTYDVPVFYLDYSEDLFLLNASSKGQQYLSIFFLMVC